MHSVTLREELDPRKKTGYAVPQTQGRGPCHQGESLRNEYRDTELVCTAVSEQRTETSHMQPYRTCVEVVNVNTRLLVKQTQNLHRASNTMESVSPPDKWKRNWIWLPELSDLSEKDFNGKL